MEPRPWFICLSSSDIDLFISHGDIPPTIQTPASSLTMESTFSLERFSAIKDLYECGKLSRARYSDKRLIGITYTSVGN